MARSDRPRRRVILARQSSPNIINAYGPPHAVGPVATAPTVRALVAHGVLAWTGPDEDAELRAELTEKGRLVAQAGRDATVASEQWMPL